MVNPQVTDVVISVTIKEQLSYGVCEIKLQIAIISSCMVTRLYAVYGISIVKYYYSKCN